MVHIFDIEDLRGIATYDLTSQGKTPKDIGIEPIASLEQDEFDLGNILIIDSIAYSIVGTASKGRDLMCAYCYKLPSQEVFLNGNEPESTYGNAELKCPFCGSKIEYTVDMDQDDDNYECLVCGSHFAYTSQLHVTYHITPVTQSAIKAIIHTDKEETKCN